MTSELKENLAWDVLEELSRIGLLDCVTVAQFSDHDIVTAILRVFSNYPELKDETIDD